MRSTKWANLKVVLISLFGATAGQGAIFYTSQFFALFYIQTVLKMDANTAYIIVAIAIACGMPFFALVGAVSDKIGRKKIIMLGCLLAAVSYIPIYKAMIVAAGNNVVTVKSIKSPVTGAYSLTPLTYDTTKHRQSDGAGSRKGSHQTQPAADDIPDLPAGASGHPGLWADRRVSH